MSADAGEIVVCNAAGDIRDRSAKSSKIAPKKHVFGPHFFGGGERRNFAPSFFKIAPIFDHVAKFRGDRPRDHGDLALNKERKTAAKQGLARCVIATGGPNKARRSASR